MATEIKASAKKTENSATRKQAENLAKAKKEKEEAALKAKENQKKAEEEKAKKEEAKKAAQEKEKEQKENDSNKEELMNLANKALSGKKSKGFIPGLLIGIVIGLLLGTVLGINPFSSITDTVETTKENADALIDETFLGYTAADFKEAVLGKAIEEQELIVMEQPLEISTTITKAGLGGLSIFSKTKDVTFAGTGEFTVDLSKIDENHIDVNEENKVVTITIERPTLHSIVIDYDNTKFEDTEKGLLSFGDLALSMEDQNELEKTVKAEMETRLNEDDMKELAENYAEMSTWQIFQPIITAVSNEFTVEIVFE